MEENLTASNLGKRPDLAAEVKEIIERELEYKEGNSYARDFYPLFNPANYSHCHLTLIDGRPIVHIGTKLRNLRHGNYSVPCALFGGLVTKAEYQGKGIFSPFFKEIVEEYAPQVGLMFLWGKHTEFYGRFNFFECGSLVQAGLNHFDNQAPEGYEEVRMADLNENERNQLKALYDQSYPSKFLSFERSANEWKEIQEVSSSRLFILKSRGGIPSYFFAHKGQDLQGIIHEQVGLPLDQVKTGKIWLPEDDLARYPESGLLYSAFVRIGNVQTFSKFLNRISQGRLSIVKCDNPSSTVKFNFDNANYEESIKNFLLMLFGPYPLKEFADFMPKLFICGLDSV